MIKTIRGLMEIVSDICWAGCIVIGQSVAGVILLFLLLFICISPILLTQYSLWWLLLYVPAFGFFEWLEKID